MVEIGANIFRALARVVYFFMKKLPTRRKITILSRQGNSPSTDLVLLKDALHSQFPDYQIVIKCKILKNRVRSVLRYIPSIPSMMYHLATSQLVILDSYCLPVSILNHKKDLKIVQIWHAMGTLKKVGHAGIGLEQGRKADQARALRMHRGYTHILVSSPRCVKSMLEAYGYGTAGVYKGSEVLPKVFIGALPRVDYLRSEETCAEVSLKVHEAYPHLAGREVILYAPTFRGNNKNLYANAAKLAKAVNDINKQGGNLTLVVKLHPINSSVDELMRYMTPEVCYSGVESDDISVLIDTKFSVLEMAMVADKCVTDFSSLMKEFIIMGKPVYFFSFDLNKYEKTRGFFIDYRKEIPGTIHEDVESLLAAIAAGDYSAERQAGFVAKYVTFHEEGSTKALVRNLASILGDPA